MASSKKSAKRPSKDPEIHLFAEKVRRWPEAKIYEEYHKTPDLAVVESVVRDMHEDILSVLAPHFDDDIMENITGILGDWYGFNKDIEFVDPNRAANDALYVASEDRTVAEGFVFKHFKGNYYRVLHVAIDSETSSTVVVYRALHNLGKAKVFVRSMESFCSVVDHEKYPDYAQKWRMQRVEEKK